MKLGNTGGPTNRIHPECLENYKLLEKIPKQVNFHIEGHTIITFFLKFLTFFGKYIFYFYDTNLQIFDEIPQLCIHPS
jgi:hypothetical protein